MTSNALMTQEDAAIETVKVLANIVRSLRNEVFKEGLDFGKIPGTGDKPTLLLPGMEKLLRALHLRAEYVEKSRIEDFEANLIYYRYECRLIDYETGLCVSTAIGSANSKESKWRWRDQKRTCPNCGQPAILKSKFPDRNTGDIGWWCNNRGSAGGCGSNFVSDDKRIIEQEVGRIENPDIFDQMNTIDKIAQKRALGSAIKGAANVSEFFTVDLEDFQAYDTRPLPENVVEGSFTVVEPSASPEQPSSSVRGAGLPTRQPEPPADDAPAADPNVYHADALVVNKTRTATQFILKAGQTNIPLVNLAVLDGTFVGDVAAVELKAGTYPLTPSWVVTADKLPSGAWDVLSVATEIPVP